MGHEGKIEKWGRGKGEGEKGQDLGKEREGNSTAGALRERSCDTVVDCGPYELMLRMLLMSFWVEAMVGTSGYQD